MRLSFFRFLVLIVITVFIRPAFADVIPAYYDESVKFYTMISATGSTLVGTSSGAVCGQVGGTLSGTSLCTFRYTNSSGSTSTINRSVSYNYCYKSNYYKTEPYASVCPEHSCPNPNYPNNSDFTTLSDSTGTPDANGEYCAKNLCESYKDATVSPYVDVARLPEQICYQGCRALNTGPIDTSGSFYWVQEHTYTFNGNSCTGNSGWIDQANGQHSNTAQDSSSEADASSNAAQTDSSEAQADSSSASSSAQAAAQAASAAQAAADAAKAAAVAAAQKAQAAITNVNIVNNNPASTDADKAAALAAASAAAQEAAAASAKADAAVAQAAAAVAAAQAAGDAAAAGLAAAQSALAQAQATAAAAQAAAAAAIDAYNKAVAAAAQSSADVASAADAAAAAAAQAAAAQAAAAKAAAAAAAANAAANAANNAVNGSTGTGSGTGSGTGTGTGGSGTGTDIDADVTDDTESMSKFCKSNPSSLACVTLGNFESPTFGDPQEIDFQINPASGFGSSNSACPAPKKTDVFGTEVVQRNEAVCQLGSMLRPLVIGLAFVGAAMIVLVGNKGGD